MITKILDDYFTQKYIIAMKKIAKKYDVDIKINIQNNIVTVFVKKINVQKKYSKLICTFHKRDSIYLLLDKTNNINYFIYLIENYLKKEM